MQLPYITPLTAPQLRSVQVPEPWAFGMADIVRFGEIDALNHVNNVEYFRWYETLRVHYLDHYGLFELAGADAKYVVKSVSAEYHAEVKRGASYINVARTVQMRNTSFSMEYATIVEGHTTTTGTAVVVLLNPDNSKRPLPDGLRAKLISTDGTHQV